MITVLMPVHRYHRWLEPAISSVLSSETDYPFELVVLANNMNKSELNQLYDFSKIHNFKIINLGAKSLPESLQQGVVDATFEFIARLDSDDVMHDNRLQLQADFLIRNPSVSLVTCKVNLISENDEIIGMRTPPLTHIAISSSLKFGNCLVHPSIMFRKSAILSVGGYKNTYPYTEDYDLYMRMIDGYTFNTIPDALTDYRVFAEQISSKNSFEQLESSKRILSNYFKNRNLSQQLKSRLYMSILSARYEKYRNRTGTIKLISLLLLSLLISPKVSYQFIKYSLGNLR